MRMLKFINPGDPVPASWYNTVAAMLENIVSSDGSTAATLFSDRIDFKVVRFPDHYVFEIVLLPGENGAYTWTVRDFGTSATIAGYIVPRTGSPVAVAAPSPAAASAGKVYIKIPKTDNGDYNAASASFLLSNTDLAEFTTESNVDYRNIQLGEILATAGENPILSTRQSWTAGDIHAEQSVLPELADALDPDSPNYDPDVTESIRGYEDPPSTGIVVFGAGTGVKQWFETAQFPPA